MTAERNKILLRRSNKRRADLVAKSADKPFKLELPKIKKKVPRANCSGDVFLMQAERKLLLESHVS